MCAKINLGILHELSYLKLTISHFINKETKTPGPRG